MGVLSYLFCIFTFLFLFLSCFFLLLHYFFCFFVANACCYRCFSLLSHAVLRFIIHLTFTLPSCTLLLFIPFIPRMRQEHHDEPDPEKVKLILATLLEARELVSDHYSVWHAWAVFNYDQLSALQGETHDEAERKKKKKEDDDAAAGD
jgi:hypothetical protein